MEKFIADEKRLKTVEENFKSIMYSVEEAAISSNRKPSDVRLMAVTKTVEAPYINHAIKCGATLIGENRVQEYMGKKDDLLLDGVETHLIGKLQTNKVKYIVGQVDMIQSVDSIKLANQISKLSLAKNIVTNVLVEVNIGQEESKSGIKIEELKDFLYQLSEISGISVKGLMTIPPICDSETQVRRYFNKMHQSFIDIKDKKIDNISMDVLSMGMSGDFKAAIAEGSNLIRVGSAIFGARNYF